MLQDGVELPTKQSAAVGQWRSSREWRHPLDGDAVACCARHRPIDASGLSNRTLEWPSSSQCGPSHSHSFTSTGSIFALRGVPSSSSLKLKSRHGVRASCTASLLPAEPPTCLATAYSRDLDPVCPTRALLRQSDWFEANVSPLHPSFHHEVQHHPTPPQAPP